MKALVNAVLDRGLFEYRIQPAEIVWALLNGAAAFVVATTTAPVNYADWQAWVIALGGALVRPVIVVIFGKQPTGSS